MPITQTRMLALLQSVEIYQTKLKNLRRTATRLHTTAASGRETCNASIVFDCFEALAEPLIQITQQEQDAFETITNERAHFASNHKRNEISRKAMARRRNAKISQNEDEIEQHETLETLLTEIHLDLFNNSIETDSELKEKISARGLEGSEINSLTTLLVLTHRIEQKPDTTWTIYHPNLAKKLIKQMIAAACSTSVETTGTDL